MDQANILIIGGGVVGTASPRCLATHPRCLPRRAKSQARHGHQHPQQRRHPFRYLLPEKFPQSHALHRRQSPDVHFCAKHNVPHRHTGKLVVAADAHEEPALLALKKNGENNGVEGLRLIGPDEIRAREPHITGIAALDVPSTGIVSAEDLVRTYAASLPTRAPI